MRIRALSVFEGIIYHAVVVDPERPCRPTLEVDAVLRPGDADGPILLSVPDYVTLVGGVERAAPCLRQLADRGRIADHLGVAHVVFAFWTPIDVGIPGRIVEPPPP